MNFNKKSNSYELDPERIFQAEEIKRYRKILKERMCTGLKKSNRNPVIDYFFWEFGLGTGLRVAEIANVKIADIWLEGTQPAIYVSCGKGSKSRIVYISRNLEKMIKRFLEVKNGVFKESIVPEAPLFSACKTGKSMSTRSLQNIFYRLEGILKFRKKLTTHSLRHTYATFLYSASEFNLRLVQKQLGHSSTKVTEMYAHVLGLHVTKALDRLYMGI